MVTRVLPLHKMQPSQNLIYSFKNSAPGDKVMRCYDSHNVFNHSLTKNTHLLYTPLRSKF